MMRPPRPSQKSVKIGLAPGTLIHVGEWRDTEVTVDGVRFKPTGEVESVRGMSPTEVAAFASPEYVTWIDINGVHDVELVRTIGQQFGLHPLLLEDVVSTTQRPKSEDYGDRLFVVLRMIQMNPETDKVEMEQCSLVIGPHFVITFQERELDPFDPVRLRLEHTESRARSQGADYLAYALIDTLVDNYFRVVEQLGERIEELETVVLDQPGQETLEEVYAIKRALVRMRRIVMPSRDAVGHLRRTESPLARAGTNLFWRDVEDHLQQLVETVDMYRDMVSSLVDIYLSSASNRMNDVMRVLTVIATIFIPLTFIVGVYGMNFESMPELSWPGAYEVVWIVMLALAGAMIAWFRKRRWI